MYICSKNKLCADSVPGRNKLNKITIGDILNKARRRETREAHLGRKGFLTFCFLYYPRHIITAAILKYFRKTKPLIDLRSVVLRANCLTKQRNQESSHFLRHTEV